MKIAFIGGGVMGEVMLSAILDKGLTTPQAIWVSDIKETRRQHLEQEYGVAVMSNNQAGSRKRRGSGSGHQTAEFSRGNG